MTSQNCTVLKYNINEYSLFNTCTRHSWKASSAACYKLMQCVCCPYVSWDTIMGLVLVESVYVVRKPNRFHCNGMCMYYSKISPQEYSYSLSHAMCYKTACIWPFHLAAVGMRDLLPAPVLLGWFFWEWIAWWLFKALKVSMVMCQPR